MILNKDNARYIVDLPFSSLRFTGFDVPYFTEKQYHCMPIFQDQPYNVYYSRGISQWAFLKVHQSLGSEPAFGLRDFDNNVIDVKPLDFISTENGWNYFAAELTYMNFNNNEYLVMELWDDSGNVLAKCPIHVMSDFKSELYLFFNYACSYNALGFPFSTFLANNPNGIANIIYGGINVGTTKYGVEQETFRDQRYNQHTLIAYDRKTSTLSIGNANGVPEHIGETLNAILCCDMVYMNGKRIVRSGDSVPEPTVISKNNPFVNFAVDIEYVDSNPNRYSVQTN